jgi:class 3 adenylate cyclase
MTMSAPGSPDLIGLWSAPVIEDSGHDSNLQHLSTAERVLAVGGNRHGLIGAISALADAGAPSRVPGTGADTLVAALTATIGIVQAHQEAQGKPPRRGPVQVTVLFTDLVGWTTVASRVWPETADELRRRHFSLLRQAVADSGGTEVKQLGDGTMVAFPTASAALACAVAMQRSVARDNRVSGHPLDLRIGLSGGEASREGTDYFGDPVIEAARLCSGALGGQILVSAVVKEMAGRRARYPYRALGGLDLKGLPEPLQTFEVGWEPRSELAMPPRPPALPLTGSHVARRCTRSRPVHKEALQPKRSTP